LSPPSRQEIVRTRTLREVRLDPEAPDPERQLSPEPGADGDVLARYGVVLVRGELHDQRDAAEEHSVLNLTIGLRTGSARQSEGPRGAGSARIRSTRTAIGGAMRGRSGAGRQSAVARQLSVEFDGVLPHCIVEAEVAAAEEELRGQVPLGSLDELLQRLAGHRLRERAGAR
jgi:hypothetical protein